MTLLRSLTALSLLMFLASPLIADDAAKEPMKAYTTTVPGIPGGPESKVTFDMVPIPAGKFLMGSPATEANRKKDEGPQIEVEVDAFWMGKHEVTWDEFDRFRDVAHDVWERNVREKRSIPKDKLADAVSMPTSIWEQEFTPVLRAMGHKGGFPACNMTQFCAKQYSKWLSKATGKFYRLPTEAEWEYACRAGSTSAFNFGANANALEQHAWYIENSGFDIITLGHPRFNAAYRKIGQKKPNAWGLYDMHGNVAEWCIDQYVADHYAKFAGKSVKALDIIAWPTKLYPRVVRGGDWEGSSSEDCRSARRGYSDKRLSDMDPELPKSPWWHTDAWHIGFRLVRPLKEPSEKEKLKYWEADAEEIQKTLDHYESQGRLPRLLFTEEKKG